MATHSSSAKLSGAHRGCEFFNQGRIEVTPKGIELVDATVEQLELTLPFVRDPVQKARAEQIINARPDGPDRQAPEGRYVALHRSGVLAERVRALLEIRRRNKYGVFSEGRIGPFRSGGGLLNVGEEPEISGLHGTGTFYNGGCHLRCKGCQYYLLAFDKRSGLEQSPADLAAKFLSYQQRGAHSIQLMTPSHRLPEIVEALDIAASRGLRIPLVYNSGGHEDLDALRALDGIVDVYVPDAKVGDDALAERFTGIKNYWTTCQQVIREMHRQVGDLKTDDRGIAHSGLLVRHLVLPAGIAQSASVAAFLAEVSATTHVHVMGQWTPNGVIGNWPDLERRVSERELHAACQSFVAAGLTLLGGSGQRTEPLLSRSELS